MMSAVTSLNPFTPEASFDDVKDVLLRHQDFSSRNVRGERGAADPELAATAAEGWRGVPVLTRADAPDHTYYRRLVLRPFAPDGVRGLRSDAARWWQRHHDQPRGERNGPAAHSPRSARRASRQPRARAERGPVS
jgi:cytochrome P450